MICAKVLRSAMRSPTDWPSAMALRVVWTLRLWRRFQRQAARRSSRREPLDSSRAFWSSGFRRGARARSSCIWEARRAAMEILRSSKVLALRPILKSALEISSFSSMLARRVPALVRACSTPSPGCLTSASGMASRVERRVSRAVGCCCSDMMALKLPKIQSSSEIPRLGGALEHTPVRPRKADARGER
jgi:hypothetical protein